jgi:hypothetical protein
MKKMNNNKVIGKANPKLNDFWSNFLYTILPNPKICLDFFCVIEHVTELFFLPLFGEWAILKNNMLKCVFLNVFKYIGFFPMKKWKNKFIAILYAW